MWYKGYWTPEIIGVIFYWEYKHSDYKEGLETKKQVITEKTGELMKLPAASYGASKKSINFN